MNHGRRSDGVELENDAAILLRLPRELKRRMCAVAGYKGAARYIREAIAARLDAEDPLPPTVRNAGDGKDGDGT